MFLIGMLVSEGKTQSLGFVQQSQVAGNHTAQCPTTRLGQWGSKLL